MYSISSLPHELLYHVFSYLPVKDLCKAMRLNKFFAQFGGDNKLWKPLYQRKFFDLSNLKEGETYRELFFQNSRWEHGNIQHKYSLKGHSKEICCLELHNERIITGSIDQTLRVWDLDSGACLHVLRGHQGAVTCLKPYKNQILSGALAEEDPLLLWDLETGAHVRTFNGTAPIERLVAREDYFLSVSRWTLNVWKFDQITSLHRLEGHTSSIRTLQLHDNIAVSIDVSHELRTWNYKNGISLHSLFVSPSISRTVINKKMLDLFDQNGIWHLNLDDQELSLSKFSSYPEITKNYSLNEMKTTICFYKLENNKIMMLSNGCAQIKLSGNVCFVYDSKNNLVLWDLEKTDKPIYNNFKRMGDWRLYKDQLINVHNCIHGGHRVDVWQALPPPPPSISIITKLFSTIFGK